MRGVWLAAAGLLVLALAGRGSAAPQGPILPPVSATNAQPVVEPGGDPGGLPGGTDVSKPLQPVIIPPEPLPALPSPPVPPPPPTIGPSLNDRNPRPGQVLGSWWDSDEFLLWWPKAQPVPALVTGSRGAVPVLGSPQTTLIVGNRAIDNQDIAGYRLTQGFSLNQDDTVGFEGRYFFLGTRTLSESVTDLGGGRFQAIGLPFRNTLTGQNDVIQVARPGQSSALVTVSTTDRVQGAEANLVANLYATDGVKLHAISGYRFFQANEGLRVEQRWLQNPTAESGYFKTFGMIADQFDGRNEFHGGQLGLMADLNRGMFFVEITGKAALGTNFEVVRIDGATHLITAASPVPLLQSFPGGVYAQPANIGRYTRSVLAVVPEGTFKVGLKLGDRGRFFVGYNFLYLSDMVRPGDQIDRTLNPSQIPLLSRGGPVVGPDRPAPILNHTDFWVQGLVIGLEGRF